MRLEIVEDCDQFILGRRFSDQVVNVVDKQCIAFSVDLTEASHVVGFDAAGENSGEFGAVGSGACAIRFGLAPALEQFMSKDGFAGPVLSKENYG